VVVVEVVMVVFPAIRSFNPVEVVVLVVFHEEGALVSLISRLCALEFSSFGALEYIEYSALGEVNLEISVLVDLDFSTFPTFAAYEDMDIPAFATLAALEYSNFTTLPGVQFSVLCLSVMGRPPKVKVLWALRMI
jgi:hypothetical protein